MSKFKEYVIFKLDGEFYGIDIQNVENIERKSKITRVPNTKDYVKGVINLRGNIIPIIDLRTRFMLPKVEMDDETRIIISSFKDFNVGLIVDSCSETLKLSTDNIDKAPDIKVDINEEYISEIGSDGNRIIMLLDLIKIFGTVEED